MPAPNTAPIRPLTMETNVWLFLVIAALTAYIFVLGLFEVYYFITLGLTAFVARFFKKRTHIMDMTTVRRKYRSRYL